MGDGDGERELLTKGGLFQARSPSFGGRAGVSPANGLTSADHIIPAGLVQGHLPGEAATAVRLQLQSRGADGFSAGDSVWTCCLVSSPSL